MKILVVHGPNLSLLGSRETKVYGQVSLSEINALIKEKADELGIELEVFQSNSEGAIIDKLISVREKVSGVIINPAAYTHTSVAIRDCISAIQIPTIEVHISNIYARENFRHKSVIAPVCIAQISGFKHYSYILALEGLIWYLKTQK